MIRCPVNSADFTQLSQFVHYAQQRFDLPWLAGAFTDSRPQPAIPSRAVWLSLILVGRLPGGDQP